MKLEDAPYIPIAKARGFTALLIKAHMSAFKTVAYIIICVAPKNTLRRLNFKPQGKLHIYIYIYIKIRRGAK